jgi:hypothetical protein
MKLTALGLLIALGLGGWYFFSRYEIAGLEGVKIRPRDRAAAASDDPNRLPPDQLKPAIRAATIDFAPLDAGKLARPNLSGRIAQIIRQFDLVALQHVDARDPELLVLLREQLNAGGRNYDFAAPPPSARAAAADYGALVFDADRVQLDRSSVELVDNRGGLFRQPPLVAAFRARGPATREAFTFRVVNAQVAPERAAAELELLAKVFRAVRDQRSGEDDVILLGALESDDRRLGALAALPHATCAVSGVPTTTRGDRRTDNILFDRAATAEFTGRSGVYDFVRELDLSLPEALELSGHLPVWAEFSVYEGGQPGAAGPR